VKKQQAIKVLVKLFQKLVGYGAKPRINKKTKWCKNGIIKELQNTAFAVPLCLKGFYGLNP